jgi:hypothetical protein
MSVYDFVFLFHFFDESVAISVEKSFEVVDFREQGSSFVCVFDVHSLCAEFYNLRGTLDVIAVLYGVFG